MTKKNCSDNVCFKHIQKTLLFESIDIYNTRVCQIEKYIKKVGISSPALDAEYEKLTEALSWYEKKKKEFRKTFPKSLLYDTGTFQPHKDLCLFVPLASFDNEPDMNEHLTKMIIAYLGDRKLPRAECEKYYPYLLNGLNNYFNIALVAKDICFLYNSLNDTAFLENLLRLGRTFELPDKER